VVSGPDAIVAFDSPPVVEVVAAVAFEAVASQDVLNSLLSAFWAENLRTDFPKIVQQPAYGVPVERFTGSAPGQEVRVRFGIGSPPVRLWAMAEDEQQLLQLQSDWFACNWRKVQPQAEYDRWPSRRASFTSWYESLLAFLAERGVTEVTPYQCEVTYINHIRSGGVWTAHKDVGAIFAAASGRRSTVPLALEQVAVQADFVIDSDDDASPLGRLHVSLIPGYGDGGDDPLYVLELTARGAPLAPTVAGTVAFLDKGREAIVRTFLSLTTPEMHSEWGMAG
jgi:uncharacterized protein (TIGR04255 family)